MLRLHTTVSSCSVDVPKHIHVLLSLRIRQDLFAISYRDGGNNTKTSFHRLDHSCKHFTTVIRTPLPKCVYYRLAVEYNVINTNEGLLSLDAIQGVHIEYMSSKSCISSIAEHSKPLNWSTNPF